MEFKEMTIRNNIINFIKEKRKEIGLSQEELAARAQISTNTISSIETGQYCCKSTTLLKILKGFGFEELPISIFIKDQE